MCNGLSWQLSGGNDMFRSCILRYCDSWNLELTGFYSVWLVILTVHNRKWCVSRLYRELLLQLIGIIDRFEWFMLCYSDGWWEEFSILEFEICVNLTFDSRKWQVCRFCSTILWGLIGWCNRFGDLMVRYCGIWHVKVAGFLVLECIILTIYRRKWEVWRVYSALLR